MEETGMMYCRESQFSLTPFNSEVPADFIRLEETRIGEENYCLTIEFALSFPAS